ncbi:DUF4149 domain-containing protein [Azonexus sp.]|jgi:hypothetical protein|uniref:DUF4149 domain-containing protein n=1 Tax=Azonexus sp. TaxID=1872668 RepID=UPI0028218CB5|nr:DUF4149 domain-containing protein [Azonexus sp.]MDR1995186.1 DUF4149 domain-containing protein [Azonexus sp.]
MRKLFEALYHVLLTLWVGGLWAIGYLAVPVLFASLDDRQLAGIVAGKLFALIGWIGLACAAYLLLFLAWRWRRVVFGRAVWWLVLGMAVLTAVGLFGIQPLMVQLKADAWPYDVMESALRGRFAAWHGVSSALYLLQSLLGLWLVGWSGRGLRD